MGNLWHNGLIKMNEKGEFCDVEDVAESQLLKRQRQEEANEAKQKEQALAQNPDQGPD